MKKIKVLFIAMILTTTGSCYQVLMAQEKTKTEVESDKDAKLKKAVEQQKKAMTEQQRALIEDKKAQEEANQELKEQDENLNDIQMELESSGNAGNVARVYTKRGGRAYAGAEPFIFSSGSNGFMGHFGGDDNMTSWDFSKSVKESSFSHDYDFDVEKTVNSVVMSVMGDCKAGDIHIKIVMPNGKSYSDIVLDEFGNLNWRKSFNISESENQDKTGVWKFQIASNKATGFFKISLQTF